MRLLLATPPMTQLNTPYPATTQLLGFLRTQKALEVKASQVDLGLLLFLRIFSKAGLKRMIERHPELLAVFEADLPVIDSVITFLQGKNSTLAYRILSRDVLPERARFQVLENTDLEAAFGSLGVMDQAKFLASLYIDDLADLIRAYVDSDFELSRYGEKLAASQPSFEPLLQKLNAQTAIDDLYDELIREQLEKHTPDILGLSVPFPGNVYGAFRVAKVAKTLRPEIKILMGGGYVNTELRELSKIGDVRVFDFIDAILLDDGERPLVAYLEHLRDSSKPLFRTLMRENGNIVLKTSLELHDIPHREIGTPTYIGLPIHDYVSLLEVLNPMHRLWSDGRWNKLMLAHGCYWKKCNFCDVSLDYIGRYDPAQADLLVDRIEAIIQETGQTGFHFVDEAAPPAVLRVLSERLIARKIAITWWGNIRFEKTFTKDLCELMARAGCLAVSGGLEVANDRILKLMNKGVTLEQVRQVTQAFTNSGIAVHAYLMYGFPSQSVEETFESLENVRDLFKEGCIQSAYWHRFSATVHSPVGKDPERFGVRLKSKPSSFAKNDLEYEDLRGCDSETLDWLGRGLNRALYNYQHGVGFELDVKQWFEPKNLAQAQPSGLKTRLKPSGQSKYSRQKAQDQSHR